MSSNGPDDPAPEGQTPNRANQLFGHKGGAKPWDTPERGPAEERVREDAGEPAGGPQRALGDKAEPRPTSSAAYPRDAQYAPRPPAEHAPEPAPSAFLGAVDDEGELTKLHPNYKLVMRVGAVITALVMMVVAVIADELLSSEFGWPFGFISGPALLLALFLVIRVPGARYNARGYQISRDRLRVVRGIMWHSDTIVPFGRVQHIDVDQGPIERAMGIATMTLHTAGSHNASVHLPGLGHELAVQMREEIRAHIKRESL